MAKTRYTFEKRQREKAKIQKREEKAQKRAEAKKLKSDEPESTEAPDQSGDSFPE